MKKKYLSRLMVFAFFVAVAFLTTGCVGGGGSSPIGPGGGIPVGTGSITGSISTSALGNVRAAMTLELTNPAKHVTVELGYYEPTGELKILKRGQTDEKGVYIFTGVPDNIRNLIVRARVGDDYFECVVPEVAKDNITMAPSMDPDTRGISTIIREAAKRGYGHKINIAEILSKIPASTIAEMTPDDLRAIAKAYVAKEKAMDAAVTDIGQDNLARLRQFGFKQSRIIIAGIENGFYSREDGWKLFEKMMSLQVKAMGLPADVLMLIRAIERKHVKDGLESVTHSGFNRAGFGRQFQQKTTHETIERLLEAFAFFEDRNAIYEEEFEYVSEELERMMGDIQTAPTAEAVIKMMAPTMPRISMIIGKIMESLGLMAGNPPKIREILEALHPPTILPYPMPPVDFARISRNVKRAIKEALPNESEETIEHLFVIIKGPVQGFGAEPPSMDDSWSSDEVPPFPGMHGPTQIMGFVKKITPKIVGNYTVEFALVPDAERDQIEITYLVPAAGSGINLSGYTGKLNELEGMFVAFPSSSFDRAPVFEVTKLVEMTFAIPEQPLG